jgi:ABC-type transport system substrate-binding protein
MYGSTDLPTNLSPAAFVNSARSVKADGNHSDYQSEQWTQLCTAVGTETGVAKLKQLYSDINDLLLDESFCVPICTNPAVLTGRSFVKNIVPTLHAGGYTFTETWVDQ